MAKGFELIAEAREDAGKGASRRLRRAGKVPAVLYGGGQPSQALSFDGNAMLHNMEQESFFSSVVTVKIGSEQQPAILKDVQIHPAKRQVVHMDLQRIVAGEKIRMNVPIHFLNEDTAKAVKLGGGTVSHLLSEIEISCLPGDLPEYLPIDIADLAMDEILHLSDLELPAGVEIPELVGGNDLPIVTIHVLKAAAEPEEGAEAAAPAAGEVPTVEGDDKDDKDD